MTAFERLRQIAENPAVANDCHPDPTARQIIEARLGRKLPAIPDMDPDERKAVKLLAIQLIRLRRNAG